MACSKFNYAKYFDINKIDLVGICKIETCNVKVINLLSLQKQVLKNI